MSVDSTKLQNIIEGALLAAGKPVSLQRLQSLFDETDPVPDREQMLVALQGLEANLQGRGIELQQVASGYRLQVKAAFAPWVGRLWEEKPQRYSRALLETLSLIAYRQPLTRGEIEDVRGVSVSTNIIRTLLEREWVRVVGHREVPGKPALYATTKTFLDYFNLSSLSELPSLAEIQDLDKLRDELEADALLAAEPGPATTDDVSDGDAAEESVNSHEGRGGGGDNEPVASGESSLPDNVIALPTN